MSVPNPNQTTLTVLNGGQLASGNAQPAYGLEQFLGQHGNQLTRVVERNHIAYRAKQAYTQTTLQAHTQAVANARDETHGAIRTWAETWRDLFSDLGEGHEELVYQSLHAAMQNDLASILQAQQLSAAKLQELLQTEFREILNRDGDEWIEQSWGDVFADLATFNEDRLKRAGH